jgi:hypothetical protein
MSISQAQLYKSIDPVTRKFFVDGKNSAEVQTKAFVKEGTMDEAVRHAVRYGAAGQIAVKNELAPVDEGTFYEGSDKTWNPITFAGGYSISGEAIDDSRLKNITTPSMLLGRKAELVRDYLWAIFFGRAFNTGYPVTDDNKALCVSDHKLADGTTNQSNVLATLAALEEESVEAMLSQMRQCIGDDGLRSRIKAKYLVTGSTLFPLANKLFTTTRSVGNNNNDDSYIKGMLEPKPFDDLVSQTNWFVITERPMPNGADGLFWEWRKKITFMTDDVPRFYSKFYMTIQRAAYGCDEFRNVWGCNA